MRHDPSRFPGLGICAAPFLPVTHFLTACAPAMASFSSPLTLSKWVPKIISGGDRAAQHAQPGLLGSDGTCYPCVVEQNTWQDAKSHAGSEEWSALHDFLVQARWCGTGNSLREALARGHFQMAHKTGSAVRPRGESATPSGQAGPAPVRGTQFERHWRMSARIRALISSAC